MAFANSQGNRVAIIGATGYGGLQLVRLLTDHPKFKITFLGGERTAGKKWNEVIPFINLSDDLTIEPCNPERISQEADYAFLSLPNGVASQLVPHLIKNDIKVIDLSADYRFKSLDMWKSVYSTEAEKYARDDYQLCNSAIYGLPEFFASEIFKSNLVSCPGCFPTASLLSLIPFLRQGLIDNDGLIIDAKSGSSGGGRNPKEHLLLSECSESIMPYGVIGHRHTREIEELSSFFADANINLQFTPHLVPMVRGILTTVYGRLRDPGLTAEDCTTVLQAFFKDKTFIDVLPVGTYPSTKWVKNTNKALISVQVDKRNGRIVIMCVIDNLLKGQAGQAVQCLNIMAGYDEDIYLPKTNFYP